MGKVFFKCKERKGRVVDEGVFFELDLFSKGKGIQGFFVYSEHYGENVSVSYPREFDFWRKS
jgi:hypothetical protein